MDLLASRKVQRFVARARDPLVDVSDALVASWSHYRFIYAFPALKPLPRLVRRVEAKGIPVILIALDWPWHPWYAGVERGWSRTPQGHENLLSQGPISHPALPSLAFKSQVLRDWGLSVSVIPTMLKTLKSTFRRIYHRTWKAYILCKTVGWHPRSCIFRILAFLQHGVDQKLALSTIKGQISAPATFFQGLLATHSVRTFVQGVWHVAPPVGSPLSLWDLNLVLSVLQKPPFENIRERPLLTRSEKVVFLVAITSGSSSFRAGGLVL